jgi:prephenate dehydrogenase
MEKKLGLIGLGAFGQFAAGHLRRHFDIVATDAADRSGDAARVGIAWGSVADAAALPYVLLAVPVQSFATVLEQIRGVVQPGALVIDVASVKIGPVREMLRLLPDRVEVLATHPMFGPESAGAGLTGHRIAVCPVRTARLEEVEIFLRGKLGLDVYVCDPETHDREIAHTQALAQFVGRALAMLHESESPVRTPGYDHFREVAETVGRDTWELFTAIQNLNPYAAEMRLELLGHLNDLQERLAVEAGVGGGASDSGGLGGLGGPD